MKLGPVQPPVLTHPHTAPHPLPPQAVTGWLCVGVRGGRHCYEDREQNSCKQVCVWWGLGGRSIVTRSRCADRTAEVQRWSDSPEDNAARAALGGSRLLTGGIPAFNLSHTRPSLLTLPAGTMASDNFEMLKHPCEV